MTVLLESQIERFYMPAPHLIAFYVGGFDLLVGLLLARYFWVLRSGGREFRMPVSWLLIIGLVNVSAAFCSANIEEAIVGLGGFALALLISLAVSSHPSTKS
jgi:hypothetical protein